jgi:hypothetical protein
MQKTNWYAAIGKGCMEDLVWGYGTSPQEATTKAYSWGSPKELLIIAITEKQVKSIKYGVIQAVKYLE